ncbi:hypothetical protein ACWGI8_17505 [Streptomyces sp. NPDC054841]
MKRSGPLFTLAAGLLLGLFMLSLNATTGEPATSSYERPAASRSPGPSKPASPPPPPSPTRTPPPSPTPSAQTQARYTGRTADDTASVAITLRGTKAVAYFCDGRTQEAWMRGDVQSDGSMRLTSDTGAELDGTVGEAQATGTVEIGDRSWQFTAPKVNKPSGLYRATAQVGGSKVKGGWIVLPDGRQVGIVTRDGKPAAAPPIDPATGAVTVDGTQLTARPVEP